MNTIAGVIVGAILCTGPLWGAALGYTLARRGWVLRSPFHHGEGEDPE